MIQVETKPTVSQIAQEAPLTGRREEGESSVLVIIPAYNEARNIGTVVTDVRHYAPFADILVIDDGSTDSTAAVAHRSGAYVLSLPYNLGIGGAVQAGFKFAVRRGYSYVVRVDGDGQHNAAYILRLLALVQQGKADVAIGSRFCPGLVTYRPPLARRLGIRFFSFLVSFITRQPVYDPTSGMQCLNRRALYILAQDYPQDYPEVEARVLLHKARLRVIETPVCMRPRATGNSSITYLRSIYYMLKVTLATLIAALRQGPHVSHLKEDLHATPTADTNHSDQHVTVDHYSGVGA
ncbi:MAG: glycosyltransferase family 2 protein [Chloroflexi bacterium]|nr:MAG: glycosyltransferase family 2 protein [Chloroflexota bacterium]